MAATENYQTGRIKAFIKINILLDFPLIRIADGNFIQFVLILKPNRWLLDQIVTQKLLFTFKLSNIFYVQLGA